MSNLVILPIAFLNTPSKFIATVAFTEYRDLMLETPDLATSNYITIDNIIYI